MKLVDYLKKKNKTVAEGARESGLGYEAFRLYTAEERIPRPGAMKKIGAWTGGKVTSADFYDSEAAA